MATVPKWQAPLVERAAAADERLRTAMLTAGGGQGALRAIVWGHRELAEVAHLLADRQSSPLVAELLRHGARALKTQADSYEHAVLNYADQVGEDDAPVWSTLDYSDDDEVDGGQALVELPAGPGVSSDDAKTNEPAPASAQASLDDALPAPGTPVVIVAGRLAGKVGVVDDEPGVRPYPDDPGPRIAVRTRGGDRLTPLLDDVEVTTHAASAVSAGALVGRIVDKAEALAVLVELWQEHPESTARTDALEAIDRAAEHLRSLRALLAPDEDGAR